MVGVVNLPRSNLLVLGSNSIQSLLPATLSAQVEHLLERHKLQEAAEVADKQKQKIQSLRSVTDNERNELSYVYQCIGFQYLSETMFEDAGKNLFLGQLDPRVLIGFFPELQGSLFGPDDEADVFAGASAYMPPESSIDDIIRNYSPHLSPNTREAPVTVELRQALRYMAEEMLERFLRNCRFQMRTGVKGKGRATPVSVAVDTVLAKIYARSQKTKELHAIIAEPNDIIVDEVESVFLASEQYMALCQLYEREGEVEKLLNAWASLADGKWVDKQTDVSNSDPVSAMESLLLEKRDRVLTARWGVWLAHRDPERGFKLLLSRDVGKRSNKAQAEEDLAVLDLLRHESPDAAAMYLEHLVLERRSMDSNLHMQLAKSCIDNLLLCLLDESTRKLWRAKYSSYTASPPPTSFLSYFASTTPDSEHKRIRLKAILFLQWSTLYDAQDVRTSLHDGADSDAGKLLSLEFAILEGKLLNHERALSILVHDLNDAISAETYCTLGGEVVPAKVATALGDAHGLQTWAAALLQTSGAGAGMLKRQKAVDESAKKSLIGVLLEVYMAGGEANAARTAQLLNSQAMNLDVLNVITQIPDDWPLKSMSNFLNRSFRRAMHDKHEQQIMKNISMSQNLRVSEESWLIIREQGAVIEEADDSETDDDDELEEKPQTEKADINVAHITAEEEGEDKRWYPGTGPVHE